MSTTTPAHRVSSGREAVDLSATRVLVVDPIHEDALRALRSKFAVSVELSPTEADLQQALRDVDVLVMRSGVRLTEQTIRQASRLRVVARAGAGIDNIDIAAAKAASVQVFNVPGQSANAVAEFTLGLILALTRRIALAAAQVRRNEWRKPDLVGYELRGSTIGIIGLGQIGTHVAQLAGAFGTRVLGTVARPDEQRRQQLASTGVELVDLAELLRQADIACLVVPLTNHTCGLIGAREFALMPRRAYLVNVSRGGVVNEDDLYAALIAGRLAGAALDVVAVEGAANRLAALDNVIVTPHIGAMTDQAQRQIGMTVVESILTALEGKPFANRIC